MKSIILLIGAAVAIKYRPPAGSNPWHLDAGAINDKATETDYPVDYVVPNFGKDEEIARIQSLYTAHPKNKDWKFVAKKDRPDEPKRDYFVPNFGVDEDIK